MAGLHTARNSQLVNDFAWSIQLSRANRSSHFSRFLSKLSWVVQVCRPAVEVAKRGDLNTPLDVGDEIIQVTEISRLVQVSEVREIEKMRKRGSFGAQKGYSLDQESMEGCSGWSGGANHDA